MSILMAVIAGLAVSVAVWFGLSYFITHLILSIEERYPRLAGSRALRAVEVSVCGMAVLASFAFAFWLASTIWLAGR